MDVSRIQRILTSLMILSFLIFGLLAGVILITDAPVDSSTASLPFAFLFISAMSLITTGQINENPKRVEKHLRDWLLLCVIAVVISALAFGFA
ncbi:MAG: hypothetical protein ACFFDR_00290 [Candidatus Thorarchaeota archaeon]